MRGRRSQTGALCCHRSRGAGRCQALSRAGRGGTQPALATRKQGRGRRAGAAAGRGAVLLYNSGTMPSESEASSLELQGVAASLHPDTFLFLLYFTRLHNPALPRAQVPAEVNNPAPFGLVRFSPDQKLLAAGVEGRVHVVDAFSGEPRFSLPTGVPPGGSAPEFAFTPDSRYLLSGARPRCGTWHLVARLSPGLGQRPAALARARYPAAQPWNGPACSRAGCLD